MGKDLTTYQDDGALQNALVEMDAVVFKRYLDYLNQFDLVPLDTTLDDAISNIRLRKISSIVYDREEDNLDKFNSVFSAVHSSDSAVCLILDAKKTHTDLYIGTHKLDQSRGSSITGAMNTLEAALKGNFQGIDISENLMDTDIHAVLSSMMSNNVNCIATVQGVPSLKDDAKETFAQGLEKLIEGMQGKDYFAVIQATPVSYQELERVEGAYQDIYTALSTFEQTNISFAENESRSVGVTLSESLTSTITKSVTDTQTTTTGMNSSTSTSKTDTRQKFDFKTAIAGAASGAVTGGTYAGMATGGLGALQGAGVGALAGFTAGMLGASESKTEGYTEGTSESSSDSKATSNSDAESKGTSKADSDTSTLGTTRTIQINGKNRRISSMLELLDGQLDRIQECKSFGMWNFSAYFVSGSEVDSRLGADLYSGLLRGANSGLERNSVAIWNRYQADSESNSKTEEAFKELQNYVSQLKSPVLTAPDGLSLPMLSPVSLISTKELSMAMSLPQKSMSGLPVFDAVEFGRSVNFGGEADRQNIEIGKISNFDVVDKHQQVALSTKSLTSHVFVTGSTGAGKSNAVYSILDKLHTEHKIPFLIIEPAKGEYKNVFGGLDTVNVFGTNPNLTSLLRINPFSFPDGIHIVEHIDRLIEILGAVWPMYAAMPAILKESVEKTYEESGWDLLNSTCEGSETVFPDFHDLLAVLPKVIHQSEYSDEMKGNYSGALVTRVKSLTNGYFSTIFQKDELESSVLFDQSCIVDLSRVGASETKALLMGGIFLKLQEYRMATAIGANSDLKHITVLEEAHNLLRRTSSEQSQEGANFQGKSVEMISNAIAEMRTYGEGFIIADQAPGLLDQSVIRNTNTKIILRLPDFGDRNLVGKAAFLNDEQINELARLKTGCAAVYQNNWLEPVLCQFEQFDDDKIAPFSYVRPAGKIIDHRKRDVTETLKSILNDLMDGNTEKALAMYRFKNFLDKDIRLSEVLDKVPETKDIHIWVQSLAQEVFKRIEMELLSVQERREVIAQVLDVLVLETPHNQEVFEIKKTELRNKGIEGVL
ncbi:ATP-binding protein [Hydrogenovibrio thermophilus]|uniref:ATP-binding protein n=1 Tax=Hydrogenovibrio thermophilus TaxID=265883 RepID=A0A451G542_9GAMM|nr:ATP-binding protein [Hydrogenovibrio thermophilus]QAB14615.1 ATP-binding protein [Hydrogenovibrio thermophilus]